MHEYRIQKRKYSSNVLERRLKTDNNKASWEVFVCPTVNKKEGDVVCNELLGVFTTKT